MQLSTTRQKLTQAGGESTPSCTGSDSRLTTRVNNCQKSLLLIVPRILTTLCLVCTIRAASSTWLYTITGLALRISSNFEKICESSLDSHQKYWVTYFRKRCLANKWTYSKLKLTIALIVTIACINKNKLFAVYKNRERFLLLILTCLV